MVSQLVMDSFLLAALGMVFLLAGLATLSDKKLRGLRDAKMIEADEPSEGEELGAKIIGGILVLFGCLLIVIAGQNILEAPPNKVEF